MNVTNCWTIVLPDGRPVVPNDDNPGHADQGMLVYMSYSAAVCAAAHQSAMYDSVEARPELLLNTIKNMERV